MSQGWLQHCMARLEGWRVETDGVDLSVPEYKYHCRGEAWSIDVFCNGCNSPQRSFGRWKQSPYITTPGSVRCELVTPGDMLRVRISGT